MGSAGLLWQYWVKLTESAVSVKGAGASSWVAVSPFFARPHDIMTHDANRTFFAKATGGLSFHRICVETEIGWFFVNMP
jgi:hypothetical protein